MEEYRRLQLAQAEMTGLYLNAGEQAPPDLTTTDLDSFLTGSYRYYTEGGLRATISRSVTTVLASSFTFALSYLVLLMVNWGNVITCTSSTTCSGSSLFYDSSIFPLTWYRFIILVQMIPLGVYTVVLSSLACVARIREAVRISKFFQEALFITSDEELHFLSWSDVVARISRYQSTSTSPLCIVQDSLSPVEIHNIIMRTENLLLSTLKRWFKEKVVEGNILTLKNMLMSVPLQSRAIQWCIHHGVLSWVFDDRYRVRSEALETVRARLLLVGLVSLALMGPLAIFAAFLLVILESDEFRVNRASIFEKEWTGLARVVFRHFSEPEVWLGERLEEGRTHAVKFSESVITNRARKSILKTVKFFSAGILVVLAAIALVQDSALLYMSIGGKSLLFLFAVFSGIMAVCTGLDVNVPKTSVEAKVGRGLELFGQTHSNLCFSRAERIDFSSSCDRLNKARELDMLSGVFADLFFRPKLINLLNELLGILLLPYFFLVIFPDELSPIISQVPLIRSEALGDFTSEGCMEARALSGQSQEMVDVVGGAMMFSSLRDSERIASLLMFHKMYRECLGLEQMGLVRKVEDFKKICSTNMSLNLDPSVKNNDWFWYLVLRELTMSEGHLSLVRMSPDLVRVGMDALGSISSKGFGG
jgi:hypothetical protein